LKQVASNIILIYFPEKEILMPQNPPPKTEIQQMLDLLKKIEKNTRPKPAWLRGLDWIFNHAFRIILYITVIVFAWKIWGLVQNLTESIEQKFQWQHNLQQNLGERIDRVDLESLKKLW
jgi:hypothetical protein